MEVLFVGNEVNGNFALAPCQRRDDILSFSGDYRHINEIINIVLEKADPPYQAVIIDIDLFIDDSEEIAKTLEKIRNVNNANFIIYAPGYQTSSAVIVELIKRGFRNYIFAISPASKIDQLEKCLNGYYEANGMDELMPIVEQVEHESSAVSSMVYKTIGIAGALPRIGTTTQAIQIVKYLHLMGYTACYIEMNNHHFIDGIKELYTDWSEDTALKKITYSNVDLFKKDNISDVLKLGYNFYVKDYGVYASSDFVNLSFLEQDINIIVAGAEPEEFRYVEQLLTSAYYQDTYYIFSFIPKADQEDLRDLMEDKKNKTFFVPYTPSPFSYSVEVNTIYQSILSVTQKVQEKKRKLFSFFKKGDDKTDVQKEE